MINALADLLILVLVVFVFYTPALPKDNYSETDPKQVHER